MDKLLPLVFCIAGLAMIAVGSQDILDGYSSSNWPKAEGIITESRIAQTGSGSEGHKAAIGYSYTVEGVPFDSDRILFGISSFRTFSKSGRQRANEWLEKYPVNRQVTVAYKPTDPGKSTLNTGAHYTAWIAPVIGLSFLAAVVLMIRSGKKEKAPSKANSSTDH